MHDTGIVRRVDDLGRIVIPVEIRRSHGIEVGSPLSISIEDDKIVLTRPDDACVICGGDSQTVKIKDRNVCLNCVSLVCNTPGL